MTISVYMPQINSRVQRAGARLSDDKRRKANQHAAKLRVQDAALLAGPQLVGDTIVIPSWRWNPELVDWCKPRGGRFQKDFRFAASVRVQGQEYAESATLPAWIVPSRDIERAIAIYRTCFAREIAVAEMVRQAR